MKYVGYAATFVGIATINAVINGWAFALLWAWFIAATFGLPEISIPVAIGIAMTVGFLMPWNKDPDQDKSSFGEKMAEAFLKVSIKSLMAVGFGWVVLQFV